MYLGYMPLSVYILCFNERFERGGNRNCLFISHKAGNRSLLTPMNALLLPHSLYIFIYLFIYLFIRLHGVLVAAHRIFLAIHELICPGAYRILVPRLGI